MLFIYAMNINWNLNHQMIGYKKRKKSYFIYILQNNRLQVYRPNNLNTTNNKFEILNLLIWTIWKLMTGDQIKG
jgi:hypothetical protein